MFLGNSIMLSTTNTSATHTHFTILESILKNSTEFPPTISTENMEAKKVYRFCVGLEVSKPDLVAAIYAKNINMSHITLLIMQMSITT